MAYPQIVQLLPRVKDLTLPRGQLVSKVLDEDSPSRCHAPFHHLDCCQARHFIRCGLWSIYYKVLIQLHSSIMCYSLWGWFSVLHLDRMEEKTLRTVVIGHVDLSHGQGDLHSDICQWQIVIVFVIVSVIGCVIVFVSLWFSAMVEVSCAQIFCTQGNQPVTQRQDPIWPGPGRPGLGSWFHSSPEKGFDWVVTR